MSAVRAISDLVGVTPGDVVGLVHPDGSPNRAAAMRYMARNPTKVPALLALARNANAAAVVAARTAAATLRHL